MGCILPRSHDETTQVSLHPETFWSGTRVLSRPVNWFPSGILAAVFTVSVLAAFAWGAKPDEKNLVPNSSFEDAAENAPTGWRTRVWNGEGRFDHGEVGRSGTRGVAISSEAGGDLSWFIKVPVQPFARYRLSGWIKTEELKRDGGEGALFNVHNIQSVKTNALRGTNDWTRVAVQFETGGSDELHINCLFGGWGLATGKAWFDDVKLELLGTIPLEPEITVDAADRGEPIDPFIYGQFIEHLGRCIYGGIWAEMLEDRKFWYPITEEYSPYKKTGAIPDDGPFPVIGASPWQVIGDADQVVMVKDDSFVGEHTPRVSAGGGIRQRDLGLVKSKRYEGYIWIKPDGDATTVDVRLRWGEGPMNVSHHDTSGNATNRYQQCPFSFTAGADTTEGMLEIQVTGGDPCFIGAVSLMPADNVQGMRSDTLRVLKELDSPIYRWPGGNFVSGYDWKDGVGDRDRRPPRTNPAWTGVEHNDFGLDEFVTFCELVDAEPLIVVNTGLGEADMAVEELQYANGDPDTPMGKLRADNGHREPYNVTWWGIGNEMYGGWQLGHMPLEDYTKKHNEFVDAMRQEDDSIKVVAVGAVGEWSEVMMSECAEHMDLISEHFYCQEQDGVIAHVNQMRDRVQGKAEAHRRYRQEIPALAGKDIRIALDEWNYWYGPHLYGELGTRYFLKDALGIAVGLNEMGRNSDMFAMANYAQTVNVIGCIKTNKTDAAFATTGLVLKLYRRQFGEIPLATEVGRPINALAALGKDGETLTLGVVNPTAEKIDVPLTLKGIKLSGDGTLHQITDDDPMAFNAPGSKPQVVIEEKPVTGITDSLPVMPYSVSLFRLTLAR
ncbi:MAG: alpha-L-arabinofuranosidase C-terminal domain-containing protein [Pirellulaceae bacterium]